MVAPPCLEGRPHVWVVGEPEYEWIEGTLMELTHWVCRICGVGRDNLCPMAVEMWTGEDWGNQPIATRFWKGRR